MKTDSELWWGDEKHSDWDGASLGTSGVSGNSLLPYKFLRISQEFVRQKGIPAHPWILIFPLPFPILPQFLKKNIAKGTTDPGVDCFDQ